jgi:hypothetical protein
MLLPIQMMASALADQESALTNLMTVARPEMLSTYLDEATRRAAFFDATIRSRPWSPGNVTALGLALRSVYEDVCAGRLP